MKIQTTSTLWKHKVLIKISYSKVQIRPLPHTLTVHSPSISTVYNRPHTGPHSPMLYRNIQEEGADYLAYLDPANQDPNIHSEESWR